MCYENHMLLTFPHYVSSFLKFQLPNQWSYLEREDCRFSMLFHQFLGICIVSTKVGRHSSSNHEREVYKKILDENCRFQLSSMVARSQIVDRVRRMLFGEAQLRVPPPTTITSGHWPLHAMTSPRSFHHEFCHNTFAFEFRCLQLQL